MMYQSHIYLLALLYIVLCFSFLLLFNWKEINVPDNFILSYFRQHENPSECLGNLA